MKKENLLIINLSFLLFFCEKLYSQETIIKNNDVWEYYDKGYLDTNWILQTEKYAWKKGNAPLGYHDKKINTEISYGNNIDDKHLLKYFKKEININQKDFLGYELRLLRDDGAVIYVNGKELFRSNMFITDITKNSIAKSTIDGDDEDIYNIHVFDSSIFKEGKNTIAVSIHQSNPGSSDCIFSLELVGHKSAEILEELIKNKDIINKDLEYQIKELGIKFKLEKETTKNETLTYANYNLKILLFIIIILFVLAIIGIYMLVENHRRKLKEKTAENLSFKEKILEKEKELLTLNTKLLNNKQYFKEIKADLKGLETKDKSTLKIIISDINQVLDQENEWQTLKNHFNAVYEGFYDRLITLHPSLTETELRHCMFIKLHMQTKEIAKILLIDPRSVQTTRYRIKKKMNLNEEIDIREYLLKI